MSYPDNPTKWDGIDFKYENEAFELSNDNKIAKTALSKNMHLRNIIKIQAPVIKEINPRTISSASANRFNRKVSAASVTPMIKNDRLENINTNQELYFYDNRNFYETKFGPSIYYIITIILNHKSFTTIFKV
jgi:hypothetical protein